MLKKVQNFLKRKVIPILAVLGVLTTATVFAETAQAKELTDVITNVTVRDGALVTQTPKDGVYNLFTKTWYNYLVEFDLNAYDNNLADGDYFTFTLPEGMTLKNDSLELKDTSTGIAIGTAVAVSNGTAKGGTVTITLKNLAEFAKTKTGRSDATVADVIDVTGNFRADFLFETDQNNSSYTLEGDLKQSYTHTFTTTTRGGTVEGQENFAKFSGVPIAQTWSSAKLASIGYATSSGSHVSSWVIRVNADGQTWTDGGNDKGIVANTLTITDIVVSSPENGEIRLIPELLTVKAGDVSGSSIFNAETMVEGTDYTITYNSDYTSFDLTFLNPDREYMVRVYTTTPGDGSKVGNSVTAKAGDTQLTQRSNNTRTNSTQIAGSSIDGTIQASVADRIKVVKLDATTGAPLKGGVFKITKPDGSTEEVTTGDDGTVLSSPFADLAGQSFTIEEITPPAGYELPAVEANRKVTIKLDTAGSVVTFRDQPISTKINIEANKTMTGRELKDGEFTAYLLNEQGNKVAQAENANGKFTFTNVPFSKVGTYNYTIQEANTGLPGVTYDTKSYPVTINVVQGSNGLEATVTSETPTIENKYAATPAKATITATKALTGRDLAADEFTFQLVNKTTVEDVITAKNTADGTVTFPELTFTEPGTFTYTVSELAGTETGMTYDTNSFDVTVTVVDNNGTLVTTVDKSAADLTFTNVFVEETTTTTTSEATTTS
ncbi:TPA: cell surface protein, partial [Streptococcus suis]|nr:cell surface protein [Streptococcus suis]